MVRLVGCLLPKHVSSPSRPNDRLQTAHPSVPRRTLEELGKGEIKGSRATGLSLAGDERRVAIPMGIDEGFYEWLKLHLLDLSIKPRNPNNDHLSNKRLSFSPFKGFWVLPYRKGDF
jgi:hypothetical protein